LTDGEGSKDNQQQRKAVCMRSSQKWFGKEEGGEPSYWLLSSTFRGGKMVSLRKARQMIFRKLLQQEDLANSRN